MGDKWTLLIVRDLMSGPRRFVELQRVLPGISTEQLRSRLNRMVADGMLTRQRYREVPPRVDYELTERARELAPVLGTLARWGYEWAWGSPRESESIDVGAIFRLIPGLIDRDSMASGRLEMTVTDGHGDGPISYLVSFSPGSATIVEHDSGTADTHIRGNTDAWVRALGPEGGRVGLRISGDRMLADTLFEILVENVGPGVAARQTLAVSA